MIQLGIIHRYSTSLYEYYTYKSAMRDDILHRRISIGDNTYICHFVTACRMHLHRVATGNWTINN